MSLDHAGPSFTGSGATGFRMLREDPHHFFARNAKGEEVRIGKKGLSKAAHERYQRLCRGGEARAAEGGEVEAPRAAAKAEPIDLARVRLVEESPTHYHLADHLGSFRVAKRGLSKATHAKVQAFAEGGESQAGPAPAAAAEAPPAGDAAPGESDVPATPAADAIAAGASAADVIDTLPERPPLGPFGTRAREEFAAAKDRIPAARGQSDDDAMRFYGETLGPLYERTQMSEEKLASDAQAKLDAVREFYQGVPAARGKSDAEIARAYPEFAAAYRYAHPEADSPAPGPGDAEAADEASATSSSSALRLAPSHVPGAAVMPSAPSEYRAAAPRMPGVPAGPKAPDTAATQKQIDDAYAQAAAAEQAKVDVAKREGAETLATQQHLEEQRQALQTGWEAKLAGWQKHGDDLRQQILDQKIDPERYWKDANGDTNVGRKVKAALGLIIGGMGAGLTHQPNAALQVIQSAIERDVDAQKTELGKKTTLLGMHMQEGHTLMAARQMAIADMKDAAAAQLAMVSTKFVGDKAQASAQANIAALQRSAAMDRQQIAMQGFDAQFKKAQIGIEQARAGREAALFPLQYEGAVLGRNMQRLSFEALNQLIGRDGKVVPSQGSQGARIDPRMIPFLPKEHQERLVALPDGSYALARTSKAAEETQKAIEAEQVLRDKMQRYGALLAKHPHGVYGLDRSEKAAAEALHDSILTDINGLAGLNRFTETEAKIYAGRVPDITAVQAVGGTRVRPDGTTEQYGSHQAKLAELGREIDDKLDASKRYWLNLPTPRRTLR